ncbi:MAG: S46 family peptidase [Candidatus Neomarinimicrobiota bacterium]|nr:MAG: S46 family peptidase [Candidatus Neomarinimicrobiota bacterium]
MFDGMYYYLFTYLKIKDIRLVYAPPSSIGNYGGEIDNWMWPRHTGDFSFLRAYVGPDGKPAEYSEDNVPFKPGKYLAFSSKGIKEGDLVFILGYPGSTMRYRTSCSVDWNQNISYPFRIKLFKSIIDMLEEESKKSPEVKIKLSSFIKGLSNAMKNNQGMIDGFKKTKLLQRKLREEEKLMEWVNRNPEIKKEYGKVLDEIKALYKEHKKNVKRDMILQYITLIPTVRYATTIQEWSIEKSKPEAERKPEYMDYRIPQLKKNFEIGAQNYYPPADKKLFRLFLDLLMELPQEERPEFINKIAGNSTESEKNIQTFIDSLFENTKITDHEMRMKMLDMTADELNKLNDPFIKFAEELNKELEKIEKKNYYFSGKITQLRPKYYKLLKLWKKEEMYPDANRTLRFTYGYVKGYSPRDAVYYRYITKLKGVIEKHTGEEPFNAPGKLIELYHEKDYGKYIDKRIKDVPVNFLATTDITGGNSGSPVFNGKGEIVGCAFDGNYEAMTSDWQFDDNLTRTIAVDSRYILFILDKFSNAKELLNELTIH